MDQRLKPSSLALSALALQVSFLVAFLADIPVARQMIGFIFLTWMPGYSIVRVLRLKLGKVETVLFSMGLSLAFLMIFAFLTNLIFPAIGITNPLSSIPMLVIVNMLTPVLVITEWRTPANVDLPLPSIRFLLYGILLSLPIIFTLAGIFLVRIPPHTNNVLLLIMMATVSVLVGLPLILGKSFPRKFFPLLLLSISISLLLHTSLFSSSLQGGDIFGEYAVFKLTLADMFWDPAAMGRVSAMLSVTVLPTIYSLLLNLDPTWVFKIVYPLIFAFVPLSLYQMFKSRMGIKVSFFSVFFFISNLVFFTELPQLARQMIGELFFALLFLTLFHKDVKGSRRWLLLFLFGSGLVMSHYAMAYIFLGLVAIAWVISQLQKANTRITLSLIILMGTVIFAWYIYTSQSSNFNDLLVTVSNIGGNFASDFFNAESRGSQVLQVVGVSGISTFWHSIGRFFYYATYGLIIFAFSLLIFKDRLSFFKDSYNSLVFLNLVLLAACIVVPNFSTTFNATRFYQVALFFLAPLCVLGGLNILRFLFRKRVSERIQMSILVLCLLIPYFLIQVGFVYEVTNEESYSLPLASYRIDPLTQASLGLLMDSEVQSGKWLSSYGVSNAVIYNDALSQTVTTYALVMIPSSPFLSTSIPPHSYVYLRQYSIAEGTVSSELSPYGYYNLTDLSPSLSESNLVFSSGCEVYYVP